MENCSCMVSVTVNQKKWKHLFLITGTLLTNKQYGGVYFCKCVTSHKISGPCSKSQHSFNFRSLYSHNICVTNGRKLKIEGGVACRGWLFIPSVMNICPLFEQLLWEGQTQGYHRRTKYFLTNAIGKKVCNSSDRSSKMNILISVIGPAILKNVTFMTAFKMQCANSTHWIE